MRCLSNKFVEPLSGSIKLSPPTSLIVSSTLVCVYPNDQRSDPHVLNLPLPLSSSSNDALPCATLTASCSDSSQPGLLIILPDTGVLGYWTDIAAAAVDRNVSIGGNSGSMGAEGTLNLSSGEQVVCMLEVDKLSYIAATSTGKLFHIALVEPSGKPLITVQQLGRSGLLGTLAGMVRSATRPRDITAMREAALTLQDAAADARGKLILILTRRGLLELWTSSTYASSCRYIREYDLATALFEGHGDNRIQTLDFLPLEGSSRVIVASHSNGTHFLNVVNLDTMEILSTTKVAVPSSARLKLSTVLKLYALPLRKQVFLVFSNAIVLYSFNSGFDFVDSFILKDSTHELVAAAIFENDAQDAGLFFIAKRSGFFRIKLNDVSKAMLIAERIAERNLETAVFYGAEANNPFDLTVAIQSNHLEASAVNLSQSWLTSKSYFVPIAFHSLESHIRIRCIAFSHLARLLRESNAISAKTHHIILEKATKMEAARRLWNTWNPRLEMEDRVELSVLYRVFGGMFDQIPGENLKDFFVSHVDRIDELIWRTELACVELSSFADGDSVTIARILEEANDIWLTVAEGSVNFRNENCELYGVPRNALLTGSVEPWRSSEKNLHSMMKIYNLTKAILEEIVVYDIPSESARKVRHTRSQTENVERESLKASLIGQFPRIVSILCQSFEDRHTWLRISGRNSSTIMNLYFSSRGNWIKSVVSQNRIDKAFEIAESIRDFRTMVELCHMEDEHGDETAKLATGKSVDRINYFIHKYKQEFAFVVYAYYIEKGQLHDIMTKFTGYATYLAEFLKQDGCESLHWMLAISQKNYSGATQLLSEVAKKESMLWSRKVKLSIGKLCAVASQASTYGFESEMNLASIQDQIYHEFIEGSVIDLQDMEAALSAAIEAVGRKLKRAHRSHPNVSALFRRIVTVLLQGGNLSPEDVIDFLTLKDDEIKLSSRRSVSERFWKALQVLELSDVRICHYNAFSH